MSHLSREEYEDWMEQEFSYKDIENLPPLVRTLRLHVRSLRARIDMIEAPYCCCCCYDYPTDRCMYHGGGEIEEW